MEYKLFLPFKKNELVYREIQLSYEKLVLTKSNFVPWLHIRTT